MCIDMCAGTCTDMCVDMCADMCTDMCTDTGTDICADMCADMCVHMCTDMRIGQLHFHLVPERRTFNGLMPCRESTLPKKANDTERDKHELSGSYTA